MGVTQSACKGMRAWSSWRVEAGRIRKGRQKCPGGLQRRGGSTTGRRPYEVLTGRRDSMHHLLEVIFEAETVPDLRQKPLYTTPSGWWWWWWWWWWCIESVFRVQTLAGAAAKLRSSNVAPRRPTLQAGVAQSHCMSPRPAEAPDFLIIH